MVFCVSKGHKSLGRSLTYQVLKMNTVHPQACLEFQLSESSVNRLGRSDQHTGRIFLDCQSHFAENGAFHCASYPIHWSFPMMGFAQCHSKPISVWIKVRSLNTNLDRNWEAQPKTFGIQMFVHGVEWLLHISSTINYQ